MRHINGAHFPNVNPGDIKQLLKAVGPLGCVTLLDSELYYYDQLRHQAPERLIHVRRFTPDWTKVDPRIWAQETRKALGRLLDDPFVCVSFSNEPNLGAESGDTDPGHQYHYQSVSWYSYIAEWNLEALTYFGAGPYRCLTVTSAFAQGHEPDGFPPDGEYTIPIVRRMINAFDLVGIHPYAELHDKPQSGALGRDAFWYLLRPFRPKGFKDASDPGGVLAQFPNKLFLITETGTFTHSDRSRTNETWRNLAALYHTCEASKKIVGVTPFIWKTDAKHPQNDMSKNDELRAILENAPRYTAADLPVRGQPPPEEPMPVDKLHQLLKGEFAAKFEDTRERLPDGDHGLGTYEKRSLASIDTLAIHHTASSPGTTPDQVYQYHAITNKWCGIGYSVMIGDTGKVWLTGSPDTIRAHVGGTDPRDGRAWNVKTLGVCLTGSFMTYQPTDAQIDATRRVIGVLRAYLGRAVPYRGHKEFTGAAPTACPGDLWDQWKARLEPAKPAIQWSKCAWAMEEVVRILEGEGLTAEAQFVLDHYVADAVSRRDAR